MSIQQLLQQVLQSGQSLVQDAGKQAQQSAPDLTSKLGGLGGFGGGFGGGALAGGALALLLGNKKFRKMGGKFAGYGGAAALGALALKTYQDWQRNNAAGADTRNSAASNAYAGASAANSGLTGSDASARTTSGGLIANASIATPASAAPVAAHPVTPESAAPVAAHSVTPAGGYPALPSGDAEIDSRIVLSAMIAAAKADGHIGAEERQLLDAEIARLTSDPADRAWFDGELAKPADPAQTAALASTPEQAAEVYLASLLVIDDQSFMERAYLDELARRLPMPAGLKEELEAKVASLA